MEGMEEFPTGSSPWKKGKTPDACRRFWKMPGMEGCQTCLAEGVPGGEGFSRRSGEWGPDGQADGGDRFQYWRLA